MQSFPSGHTASTAAMALTVAGLLDATEGAQVYPTRLGAMALILLVAETRLLLDGHWASDVVAGALLGSATGYTALAVVRAGPASSVPVFPPTRNADDVLAWLDAHPAPTSSTERGAEPGHPAR